MKMPRFHSALHTMLYALFLTTVLFMLVLYFHVENVNLNRSGQRIKKWTRVDVLDSSKFPRPNLLPCDWKPEAWNKTTRSLCFLACDTTSDDDDDVHRNIYFSTLICKQVRDSTNTQFISSLSPEEAPCLKHFINQHCYEEGDRIPRVVHYVRFGIYQLTLEAFFGMYSAARFLQPCLILIHGTTVAPGPYWRMLLHLVPNIVHVQMDRPREIFGRRINVVQHSSDVARLNILLEYGGIYADFDQLFLHSFDDLLDKDIVLGLESPNLSINNALIVAKPKSEFLQIWLSNYTTFNDNNWAAHSTRLPFHLYKEYPHLMHLVYTFYPPVSEDRSGLYKQKQVPYFNLTTGRQYGLHLYVRDHMKFIKKKRLDKQNNVAGDAIRHILYGDHTACVKPTNTTKSTNSLLPHEQKNSLKPGAHGKIVKSLPKKEAKKRQRKKNKPKQNKGKKGK